MRQSYFLEKLVSLVKLVTSESGNRKKKVSPILEGLMVNYR